MTNKEAKNVMVSVTVTALTLGTLGFFMQVNNPFQAAVFVLVALTFMAFYAMKYRKTKTDKKGKKGKKK